MKIGDIVRIKNIQNYADAAQLSEYGYNTDMTIYSNKVYKIRELFCNYNDEKIFRLEGIPDRWTWTEKWLEKVSIKIKLCDLV